MNDFILPPDGIEAEGKLRFVAWLVESPVHAVAACTAFVKLPMVRYPTLPSTLGWGRRTNCRIDSMHGRSWMMSNIGHDRSRLKLALLTSPHGSPAFAIVEGGPHEGQWRDQQRKRLACRLEGGD